LLNNNVFIFVNVKVYILFGDNQIYNNQVANITHTNTYKLKNIILGSINCLIVDARWAKSQLNCDTWITTGLSRNIYTWTINGNFGPNDKKLIQPMHVYLYKISSLRYYHILFHTNLYLDNYLHNKKSFKQLLI